LLELLRRQQLSIMQNLEHLRFTR